MKKFPKTLAAAPGVESTLEASMIVVCFKNSTTQEEVGKLVAGLKLVLFTGDKTNDKIHWNRVNHTDTRFWLKTSDGKSIDDARFAEIEKTLGSQVAWIGPVYENKNKKGGETCFCPIPDVVLIPKTKSQSIASVAKEHGLTVDETRSKYLRSFHYLHIPAGGKVSNAFELKTRLAASGGGEVFFENMPMLKPTTAVAPNDTYWGNQWDMVQINAPAGWDLNQGDSSIVICILDEGCDLDHPDLQFAGPGINLGTMSPPGSPTGAHGTACAGIAAATMNNNAGVAGVAGNCRILPVAFQYWTDIECAMGLNYAASNGAHVISMSFGVYDDWGWNYAVIDPEIQYAFDQGVVLVAASGNEDINYSNRYPGRHPLVMAIGGSSFDDNRKTYSSPDGEGWGANYGEEYYNGVLTGLSVVAPCVQCPTTDILGWNGGYSGEDYYLYFNGTSSATPHVAGLAALLKSQDPGRTNVQIREIIERSAAKVGSVPYAERVEFPNGTRNQEMGYGRIDVLAALSLNPGGDGDCEDLQDEAAAELQEMAENKVFHVPNRGNDVDFEIFTNDGAHGGKTLNASPGFYLHWGNDRRDTLETDGVELLVLSACNPFSNVEFMGITIPKIEIVHADGSPVESLPDGTPAAQIIPSRLIQLPDIAPLSCSSIELVLKTSGALAGSYALKLHCCVEEVFVHSAKSGAVAFDVELING